MKPRFTTKSLLGILVAASLICGLFAYWQIEANAVREEFEAEQALVQDCGVGIAQFATAPIRPSLGWNPLLKEEYRHRVGKLHMSWDLAWLANPSGGLEEIRLTIRKNATHLPYLSELSMTGPEFTDADVAWAASLPNLRRVNICKAAVSDHGVQELAKCKQLEELWIVNFGGTMRGDLDPAIFHDASMVSGDKLREAELTATGKTLPELSRCAKLKQLKISGLNFDRKHLAELSRLRPDITIDDMAPSL